MSFFKFELLVWVVKKGDVPPWEKPPPEPEEPECMYKFIQLTETGGGARTVHVNVVAMASMFIKAVGKTEVFLHDGRVYEVVETPDEILALIAQVGDIIPPPTP